MLSDAPARRRSRAARCGGSFGDALRVVRCEQHIDQLSLALALGASDASYICRLERGVRTNPSFSFVRRIIEAFDELDCPLTPEQQLRLAAAAIGRGR
ncbi:MAG: helix-turn-helix domain-containing protein [Chloroflexota bacterium]|nr:helix-turn-helix domain-containing protein [Chloroflexota bacterium]